MKTEPTSLDPAKSNSIGDGELQQIMNEGLLNNNAGEIAPGLAESWEISDDGLTYTFHLRDAVWADGQPVTANDFVYGLQRLANPETASPGAWVVSGVLKNGTEVIDGDLPVEELGISAPDEKTVVFELDHPQAYFLGYAGGSAFLPQRQDIVEQYGQEYAGNADKLMTCGPFTMTSSADRTYIFEKNPNYWDAENIKLDRIEVYVVENGDTALSMYENGELDYGIYSHHTAGLSPFPCMRTGSWTMCRFPTPPFPTIWMLPTIILM